ncbi:MAG: serine/threonine-protein kinase [Nannocystaceae bacterium]|nr:serine/threonine-protein kinase [Nannocystaceae bacterium]
MADVTPAADPAPGQPQGPGDPAFAATAPTEVPDSHDGVEPWLAELAAAPSINVPRAPPLRAGTMIEGRYRVIAKLGAGGMGVVYRAHDLVLEREVALKLHALGISDLSVSRLWREAKAMAQLNHPNVVTIHEVGTFAGRVFIAMEYVDGGTLRQWFASPRSPAQILAMFVAAGRGLAAAHAVGIVHRDFKPDNVLVGSDGRPRVGDFGVARGRDEVEPEPATPHASGLDSGVRSGAISERLTATGSAVGTPAYMAPEQVRGMVDARSDQFAFCVSLFEALAGHRPFEGKDMIDLDLAVEAGRIPALPRAVPAHVVSAIARGMHFDASKRFEHMDALLRELERDPGRRRRWLAVGAVATVGTAWLGWTVAQRPSPCADADAPVRAVWGTDARAGVVQAMLATGSTLASSTAEWTGEALDAQARAIATMRHEACAATHERGEQSSLLLDRRMLCLQQRLDELAAAREVFLAADDGTVLHAQDVVEGLGSVGECADTERLLAGVALPTPGAQAEAVAAVRERIARVVTLARAGKPRDGAQQAAIALEDARASGYAAAEAEARLAVGEMASNAMEVADAEAALREAFYLALQLGHDPVMGDAAAHLLTRTAERGASVSEVDSWHRIAQAVLDRVDAPVATRVELMQRRAHAEWSTSRLAEAEQHAREALALADALGRDDPARRAAMSMAARILTQRGGLSEARELQRLAFEAAIRARGPMHPEVATSAEALGETLLEFGDAEGAKAMLGVALTIRSAAYGADSLPVAETLNALGSAVDAAGDAVAAARHFQRAIAIVERESPEDRQTLARLYNNAAQPLLHTGDRDAAMAAARAAVEHATAAFGERHHQTGIALATLATIESSVRGPAAAEPALARALEVLDATLGPASSVTLAVRLNHAATLTALARFDEAAAALDRAHALLWKDGDPPGLWQGHWWNARAALLAAQGQHRDADESFGRAAAAFERIGDTGFDVAELHRAWARTRVALHDDAGAVTLLLRAVALLEAARYDPAEVAATRFELARARWDAGEHDAARALAVACRVELDAPRRAELDAWLRRHGA